MEKEIEHLKHNLSELQKDLNRVRKLAAAFNKSNEDKLKAIAKFDFFIKKLLKENRVTKEELKEYITKKS